MVTSMAAKGTAPVRRRATLVALSTLVALTTLAALGEPSSLP